MKLTNAAANDLITDLVAGVLYMAETNNRLTELIDTQLGVIDGAADAHHANPTPEISASLDLGTALKRITELNHDLMAVGDKLGTANKRLTRIAQIVREARLNGPIYEPATLLDLIDTALHHD